MYKKICSYLIVFCLVIPLSVTFVSAKNNAVTTPNRLAVDVGQGCAISVADVFKGRLESGTPLNASYWTDTLPIQTDTDNFDVDFHCEHVTDKSKEELTDLYGGTYDVKKKKWVAYYANASDRESFSPVTHFYRIKNNNNSGFARTTDDVIGDPVQRERFAFYCLFHDDLAACGYMQVMRLVDPKENKFPYVLDILRTVEFIDPAATVPVPPAKPLPTAPK